MKKKEKKKKTNRYSIPSEVEIKSETKHFRASLFSRVIEEISYVRQHDPNRPSLFTSHRLESVSLNERVE